MLILSLILLYRLEQSIHLFECHSIDNHPLFLDGMSSQEYNNKPIKVSEHPPYEELSNLYYRQQNLAYSILIATQYITMLIQMFPVGVDIVCVSKL